MIRVAIIGIGGYGRNLTKLLLAAEDKGLCRLVAAADGRLGELAAEADRLRQRGVKLHSGAMEMLDELRGRCEAVYVAVGIASHRELTCAAAGRGLHVHLEKPPAATVQEVDAMIEAVDRAGVLCLVSFQFTWCRPLRLIQKRVAAGRLGRLQSAACFAGWSRTADYYGRNGWAGKLRTDQGWVLDGPATNAMAHHIMALLQAAAGRVGGFARPAAVRAELYAAGPIESHDTAAIHIRTDGGADLHFLGSHCPQGYFGPILEVRGDSGRATWTPEHGAVLHFADGTEERCPADDPHQAMVEGFLGAIERNDRSALACTLADGRNMVAVIDAAHESSGTIYRIPPSHACRLEEGTDKARTVVEGMDELLRRCAEGGRLFSDLADRPPWAVATAPFDLAGYRSFPSRFRMPPTAS